jgi:hypothetical protein
MFFQRGEVQRPHNRVDEATFSGKKTSFDLASFSGKNTTPLRPS